MKSNPKISVIIPVYNPGIHFYKCLDSIIMQTYKNLEIILIDDGSSDGSETVCDDYRKKDSRIKVVHQKNSGVSHARNVGLEMATGQFVSFPDSDDYVDYDTFEVALEEINKNEADAACFEYNITYSNREIQHRASDNKYGVFKTEDAINELLFSNRSFLCTKLLPMYAVNNVRFIENIYRDEDTIFCMMVLQNIRTMVFIDKPLYHYVQSAESACRGAFRSNQLSAIDAIPIMENFLCKNYPNMINKWRCSYMHLMVMLYVDMYNDNCEYTLEKKKVYNTYKRLSKGVSLCDVGSIRNIVKFRLFRLFPEMFCVIHRIIWKQ